MKGLLLKDLLNTKKHTRIILITIIMLGAISFFMKDSSFITGYIILMCTMMVFNSFTDDNLAKWDRFILASPVSRNEVVMSKYLLACLLLVGGIAASTMLAYMGRLFGNFGVHSHFQTAGIISIIAVFAFSVLLPLIYKFGVEKSRVILIAFFMVPFLLIFLADKLGISFPSAVTLNFIVKIIPVFAVIAMVISYFISIKIYSKKEF